jgi:predicted SnoaL-like aldol condensation-catalyzing enzyme
VARPARTNPPGFPEGVEGVRRFFAMFREAMPDVEVTIDELIVDGDRAAVPPRSGAPTRASCSGCPRPAGG